MPPPCPLRFLVSLLLISSSTATRLHPRFQLMTHLLKMYPRDGKFVPPMQNTTVNLTLSIYSVFGLDENEVMEMNGWARLQWLDPRLSWHPSERQFISRIFLPRSRIWVPDIGITNSKEWENKDFSLSKDQEAEVRSSGSVSFYSYFLSKTPCPIDTVAFPFDEQCCPVVIGTAHSKSLDFTIRVANVTSQSLMRGQNTVGQWKPTFATVREKLIPASPRRGDKFQVVQIDLVLSRKPTYHVVMVIVPYCLICVVGALLFVIRSPSERFALSLTILLAMSVYVMIVAQGAPKSMRSLSAMDKFLLLQMALHVVMTFVVVVGPICLAPRSAQRTEEKTNWRGGVRSRLPAWSHRCDLACLLVFLLASAANGGICIGLIPKTAPSMTSLLGGEGDDA